MKSEVCSSVEEVEAWRVPSAIAEGGHGHGFLVAVHEEEGSPVKVCMEARHACALAWVAGFGEGEGEGEEEEACVALQKGGAALVWGVGGAAGACEVLAEAFVEGAHVCVVEADEQFLVEVVTAVHVPHRKGGHWAPLERWQADDYQMKGWMPAFEWEAQVQEERIPQQ